MSLSNDAYYQEIIEQQNQVIRNLREEIAEKDKLIEKLREIKQIEDTLDAKKIINLDTLGY